MGREDLLRGSSWFKTYKCKTFKRANRTKLHSLARGFTQRTTGFKRVTTKQLTIHDYSTHYNNRKRHVLLPCGVLRTSERSKVGRLNGSLQDDTALHGCSCYLHFSNTGEAGCAHSCWFWLILGVENVLLVLLKILLRFIWPILQSRFLKCF